MEELAYAYQYIYIFFVLCITIPIVRKYKYGEGLCQNRNNNLYLLILILVAFIGFRPNSRVFVDMGSYIWEINTLYKDLGYPFSWEMENKVWNNLEVLWSYWDLSPTSFFVFCAFIYFGASYIGISRLFPDHKTIAYIAFLGAFSTFSYATNGIKAGCATSIFLMALGFWDNKKISIPLVFLSWGFHHSMIIAVVAYFVALFTKNSKWAFYLWLMCAVISILHITFFQELFAGFADEGGAGYLHQNSATAELDSVAGGFRPDFLLYSAAPVWIGYKYLFEKKIELSPLYHKILSVYLVTNGIWLLCMYAAFTNRIAYISWSIYPVILLFPFLDSMNPDPLKFTKLSRVTMYHLSFTIFMFVVYYGILRLGT